jgi:PleD family two-component response regulator
MAAVRAAHIGPSANLSVSAGVATSPRSLGELDHLVQRADSHVMEASGDGRDRVICDAVWARSGWGGDPKAAAPE